MDKIIINGANGRMGQATVATINNQVNMTLVAKLDKNDNLEQAIADTGAHMVIDFTQPECVYQNTLTIIKANAHPIIGTTGLKIHEIENLQQLCAEKQLGGIIAPNFAIGALLMMKFAKEAIRYFDDVEIIEAHHPNKKDAPSGTAIKTAELIASHRQIQKETPIPTPTSQSNNQHARGFNYQGIPIHALRLPGVVADQTVIFGGQGQTFTLQHKTIDRNAFMPGVILACQKVKALKELVYGLDNLL